MKSAPNSVRRIGKSAPSTPSVKSAGISHTLANTRFRSPASMSNTVAIIENKGFILSSSEHVRQDASTSVFSMRQKAQNVNCN